ncbi:hypothetical protein ECANGB1_1035 [Enterospora canceri]|uniref:Uncharacterized protein n=1 Tax=Enterospora canceri TaxID=1081671 RepID=A0A1Y1S6Y1_9MICR|nr:hypothetical protein ECANGB1_1035 [Enterospora canceri]
MAHECYIAYGTSLDSIPDNIKIDRNFNNGFSFCIDKKEPDIFEQLKGQIIEQDQEVRIVQYNSKVDTKKYLYKLKIAGDLIYNNILFDNIIARSIYYFIHPLRKIKLDKKIKILTVSNQHKIQEGFYNQIADNIKVERVKTEKKMRLSELLTILDDLDYTNYDIFNIDLKMEYNSTILEQKLNKIADETFVVSNLHKNARQLEPFGTFYMSYSIALYLQTTPKETLKTILPDLIKESTAKNGPFKIQSSPSSYYTRATSTFLISGIGGFVLLNVFMLNSFLRKKEQTEADEGVFTSI